MIYGEAITIEKEPDRDEEERYKVYVKVVAVFTEDGRLITLQITWKDGRKYNIDRILDCRRAASLKGGGMGIRYTCRICSQISQLYYEENNRWFMVPKEV